MEIYGDIQNSKISHKHAYSYVFIIVLHLNNIFE